MSIQPGAKLGRYEILSQLGQGGMGEVYRARDEKLNRDVAIKVLPASFSQDVERLRRFEQEAQAAGTLNHPNIPRPHRSRRNTAWHMRKGRSAVSKPGAVATGSSTQLDSACFWTSAV